MCEHNSTGLLITCHVTNVELPRPFRIEMIRYLTHKQNSDGGWGLHIESKSTIFGTGMNYTAMRLLGVPMEDERMKRARKFLAANDGIKGIPSWVRSITKQGHLLMNVPRLMMHHLSRANSGWQ